ncbi:MAG: hypothetical protein B1H03_05900 [Planctomycetales bacterium 4484_113]|nr:MAG: hypothetical protein B1H03_05900 [Planctomycetales bacterium 4484_113]
MDKAISREAAGSVSPAKALVLPSTTLAREAREHFHEVGTGAAAVVEDARHFSGVLLRSEVDEAVANGAASKPIGALGLRKYSLLPDASPLAIRRFCQKHGLDLVPFVDEMGFLREAASREEAYRRHTQENAVVIMAGGRGMRLRPMTENRPKPMLPLGDGPLLEHIVDHLVDCGFYRFHIAVHYLKEQIIEHFGDGNGRGLSISYLIEETPLGTAGALSRLADRENLPLIVNNGDVITTQPMGEVLRFHRDQKAQLTVLCKAERHDISYGVVEVNESGELASISEKPSLNYLINTGIYVVDPEVLKLVPARECYMTEVIRAVRAAGGRVVVFETKEYWRDVGTFDSYARVIRDMRAGLV